MIIYNYVEKLVWRSTQPHPPPQIALPVNWHHEHLLTSEFHHLPSPVTHHHCAYFVVSPIAIPTLSPTAQEVQKKKATLFLSPSLHSWLTWLHVHGRHDQ